jgi:phosphohistidine swiveling domain-containing protein
VLWRRIVIRQDSIIRFWCVGSLDAAGGLSRVFDSDALRAIALNRQLTLSDGSFHTHLQDIGSLMQGMMAAARERLTLFEEVGKHYENICRRWLRYMESMSSRDLTAATNAELVRYFNRFLSYYKDYGPILYVPFVVERRYAAEYPQVLQRLAETLVARARLAQAGGLDLLLRTGALQLAQGPGPLLDRVREIVEYSPRLTMAEEKDAALLELAAAIEAHSAGSNLFSIDEPPAPDVVKSAAPELYERLEGALRKHGWISHWGYPPLYHHSTVEDFVAEVHARIHEGARQKLAERARRREEAKRDHVALLRIAELTPIEKQLIRDINYYNFLRTYRMEAKMRAQYLSVPLLREIERRAVDEGKLERDDIFLLVPPEILNYLATGTVPSDVGARRKGWVLTRHAGRNEWQILVGQERERFLDEFYSVIDWRENARGVHTPGTPFVGGKGLGLFKLAEAGVAPPPFFVLTTHAFRRFMQINGLLPRLAEEIAALTDEPEVVGRVSRTLRSHVEAGDVPPFVLSAIEGAWPELGVESAAVRSSATVEDAELRSWAGRFESVLGVNLKDLPRAVKRVWSSLFAPPALVFAREAGVNLLEIGMAVIVEQMVPATASGVMNTTLDMSRRNVVEIEAALGYGTAVVNGEVTPDRFLVEVDGVPRIIDRQIARQTKMATVEDWRDVPESQGRAQKLPEEQILELARLGKRLEGEFGAPLDIEFALAGNEIRIVQARPQTGLVAAPSAAFGDSRTSPLPPEARLVAIGLKGKVRGLHDGRAQVLANLSEAKRFERGNVLVLQAATPAWDPVIFRASALITNEGGATSHAIRVSNERGIPAIVGTSSATDVIADGSSVLLDMDGDPFKGKVYLLP